MYDDQQMSLNARATIFTDKPKPKDMKSDFSPAYESLPGYPFYIFTLVRSANCTEVDWEEQRKTSYK